MFLVCKGIETGHSGSQCILQPVVCRAVLCYVDGTSEKLFEKGLCIPAGPCVTDEDVAYIVSEIKSCICK